MWDQRYGDEDFAYGKEPNEFLKASIERLQVGRALCVADGEGRNGVFLAEHGFDVLSVDASEVGLAKANRLARERGVQLKTVQADLNDYEVDTDSFDLVVCIFAHLPAPLRRRVHQACVAGLRPGGLFLLEAYRPEQLERGTGGPPKLEMLYSLDSLKEELKGLEFMIAQDADRELSEGRYHKGASALVQILGRKS